MKQVVISVQGGVADIEYSSDGVEVSIVDFDNAKAEGKDGERQLAYWVSQAKKDEKKPEEGKEYTTDKAARIVKMIERLILATSVVQIIDAERLKTRATPDYGPMGCIRRANASKELDATRKRLIEELSEIE